MSKITGIIYATIMTALTGYIIVASSRFIDSYSLIFIGIIATIFMLSYLRYEVYQYRNYTNQANMAKYNLEKEEAQELAEKIQNCSETKNVRTVTRNGWAVSYEYEMHGRNVEAIIHGD